VAGAERRQWRCRKSWEGFELEIMFKELERKLPNEGGDQCPTYKTNREILRNGPSSHLEK